MNQVKALREEFGISQEDFSFYFEIPLDDLEKLEDSDNSLEVSYIKDLLKEKWQKLGCEKFRYESKMQYIDDLHNHGFDVFMSALGAKTRQARLIDMRLRNSDFTAREILESLGKICK